MDGSLGVLRSRGHSGGALGRLLASAPSLNLEDAQGGASLSAFVSTLKGEGPRVLVLLVTENEMDGALALLGQINLNTGDVIVSGCAASFLLTISRAEALLSTRGVQYIDCSRPFFGKLNVENDKAGLVLLVGSSKREAATLVETVLSASYGACTVQTISSSGSGQYLRMAHDGLQTALVQLHCEVHQVLCVLACAGSDAPTNANEIYEDWAREDEGLFTPALAKVLPDAQRQSHHFAFNPDAATAVDESTASENWLAQESLQMACPIPTITAALEAARMPPLSEGEAGDTPMTGPAEVPHVAPDQIASDCRDALRLAYMACYAQILALLQASSRRRGWDMDLGEVVRAWQSEGCMLGSTTLQAVASALPGLKGRNVLSNRSLAADASRRCSSLRRIVTIAVASGLPVPAMSATIAYLDIYRRRLGPAVGGDFGSSLSSWM